ncbi:MAG: hypothetical protein ACOYWZ_00060 [Bacillota bacterium]
MSDIEIQPYLVYYIMAKEFGVNPENVDKMDAKLVDAMLYTLSEQNKHEEMLIKQHSRR